MNLEHLLTSNLKAELAKRNILDFVQYIKSDYQANWHHKLLCEKLDQFVRGEIKRLMVFMPPQHGKSELVSRMLPAYLLGKNPAAKVVLASYSSSLSSTFNRDCQRYIDSPFYAEIFPKTKLGTSNTETGSWVRNSELFETVDFGGFLKTVGVGGSLTGTPADFAIIDDPVKDSIEAMSAVFQERNWSWYNDVLYTRIHNDTGILITQTRWNVNDLSGKLIEQMEKGGEQWTILCLPAIKVDNRNPLDPRQVDEALWPAKHSLEKLKQVRSQSIRTYEALYQQEPKPTQAGGEFYAGFTMDLVTDCKYDPLLPLHLTFDFNVQPYMTCCVWQMSGKKCSQIAEICLASPNNKTKNICDRIKLLYPNHKAGMFIYGDPSGRKEDTRQEKGYNDFVIIRQQLAQYRPCERVALKAPSVVMRGNFINTIFLTGYEGIEISIDKSCNNTIEDYLYLKQDADGTKLKERAKDPATGVTYEKYGHTSDANDYFLCYAFMGEFTHYQRGGVPMLFRTGKNKLSHNHYN